MNLEYFFPIVYIRPWAASVQDSDCVKDRRKNSRVMELEVL